LQRSGETTEHPCDDGALPAEKVGPVEGEKRFLEDALMFLADDGELGGFAGFDLGVATASLLCLDLLDADGVDRTSVHWNSLATR
jgi:hypothetical protein